eukprot:1184147-Prorocentrum_minimum.AAC.1
MALATSTHVCSSSRIRCGSPVTIAHHYHPPRAKEGARRHVPSPLLRGGGVVRRSRPSGIGTLKGALKGACVCVCVRVYTSWTPSWRRLPARPRSKPCACPLEPRPGAPPATSPCRVTSRDPLGPETPHDPARPELWPGPRTPDPS